MTRPTSTRSPRSHRRGRPADVCVADTGEMYVSDDLSGTIYRVCHSGWRPCRVGTVGHPRRY
ncbi:hypothetical protein BRC95_01535 [Halobacteriales archaeon QS_5_68_33]|nr:MAG: hypothetical protein BRC95_01535 [Halobacteriales archaeon QS_5_68_33]